MESTPSSPMASTFMVSAPGKVIVFGEHAAVYGKPAIAAAISLRSYLFINTLSESERTVTLDFKDIGLHHTWDIDSLPWTASQRSSERKTYYSHGGSLDTALLEAVKPHVDTISPNLPDKERKIHHGSATAFLYLFLSLGSPQSPGFVYTLRSTIPVGAGLGSSASVCVCLSAALLIQAQIVSRPYSNQPVAEAEEQVERINSWAYAGELCIHGDPSGVDNTVSCRGKAVLFRKNLNGDGPSSVTPLVQFPRLRLLLVDTKQPRTTAEQVEKVRELKEKNPMIIEPVLEAVGQLTEDALKLLSTDFTSIGDRAAIDRLGRLFSVNHELLITLGASHACLDYVCELVLHAQIGWAKLTGAGGGGCAIILPRPDVSEEAVKQLERKLSKERFQKHEAVLGAAGVGVLWCGSFGNCPEGEMKEIDQDQFANAVDSRAIERLVGIGGRENRDGWMFWNAS